jgi:hypothetical protein
MPTHPLRRVVATSRTRRLGLCGLATAALLAVIMPATTLAATRPTRFDLTMRTNCIGGDASDNASVHLVWKSAAGTTKLNTTVTAASYGRWDACAAASKVLKPTDTIKATVGSTTRKFVVPNLTIVVDRAHDVLRGKGPQGSTLALSYHAGIFADYFKVAETTVDANGNWAYTGDPEEGDISLVGGIDADALWVSPKTDTVYVSGMAPFVRVRLGESAFSGEANPGQSVKVTLRDGVTDAFKARGKAIGTEPGQITGGRRYSSEFRDDQGNPVAISVGDHLVAPSIASDADWIVPNIEGTASAETDVVSGRCFGSEQNETAIVDVYRSGDRRGRALINLGTDGTFERDMNEHEGLWYDPVNIKTGDQVVIECLMSTGDWVELAFIVS